MTMEELVEVCRGLRLQQPAVSGFVVTPYGYEVIKGVAIEEELQAMLRGAPTHPMLAPSMLAMPLRIATDYPPKLYGDEVFLDVGGDEGC